MSARVWKLFEKLSKPALLHVPRFFFPIYSTKSSLKFILQRDSDQCAKSCKTIKKHLLLHQLEANREPEKTISDI